MVYRDRKPQTLIDWDTAVPGPRVWDIAYAVYRFIPLSYAQDMQELGLTDLTTQASRLRLFSQPYGLTLPYEEILDAVERRLEALYRLLLGHLHDPVYRKMIDEGHLDHYRHDIESLQHHRTQLEQYL
jgi:hypothetical protein